VNAFALRIEAEILVKQGSLSRAYSLACVGIEELAKAKVCLGLRDGDQRFRHYANHEKFWAFWRDHQLKVASGSRCARGFRGPIPYRNFCTRWLFESAT
jgi:AbiV family abortive infection protein